MKSVNGAQAVGRFFIKGGEIYQCVGFATEPTLIYENMKTKRQETCCISSLNNAEFIPLIPENEVTDDN